MGLWSREERCSGPACPLSPEKCPLKNPKPPPKMMPCFKSDWGYFSAQAQLTAATCSQGCGIPRPDEGAGPFPCGSESHMAGPSWVSWSGTLQGPLHLPLLCVSKVTWGPRVSTRCKHCFLLLVIFSLTVDTLAPLKANRPVGLLGAEKP